MHKQAEHLSVHVEFTGKTKNGVSTKSGTAKPWWIMEAYAQFPGERYPQALEVFTFDAQQVRTAGFYEVPVAFKRDDGRVSMELDYLAARPVSASPTRASAT
jgi:hypothetical protein